MLGSVVQVHLSPPNNKVRPSKFTSLGFAASALIVTGLATAQLRTIPEDAKRGQLRPGREMIVEIDGSAARLAPGAQIRSRDNRIVLPVALPPEPQLIKYQVDSAGMVKRVWILTDDEAAKPDKKP